MKNLLSLGSLFLTGAAIVCGQTPEIQKAVDTRLELKRLEGTWKPESINVHGRGEEREAGKTQVLIFTGKTFQRRKNGKIFMEGRLEIDPSPAPKTLDMIVTDRKPAGKSVSVYELKGDTLTVCYDIAGKGRPRDLKAGKNRSLVVYKRQQ